jgi:hypothetical protein
VSAILWAPSCVPELLEGLEEVVPSCFIICVQPVEDVSTQVMSCEAIFLGPNLNGARRMVIESASDAIRLIAQGKDYPARKIFCLGDRPATKPVPYAKVIPIKDLSEIGGKL